MDDEVRHISKKYAIHQMLSAGGEYKSLIEKQEKLQNTHKELMGVVIAAREIELMLKNEAHSKPKWSKKLTLELFKFVMEQAKKEYPFGSPPSRVELYRQNMEILSEENRFQIEKCVQEKENLVRNAIGAIHNYSFQQEAIQAFNSAAGKRIIAWSDL